MKSRYEEEIEIVATRWPFKYSEWNEICVQTVLFPYVTSHLSSPFSLSLSVSLSLSFSCLGPCQYFPCVVLITLIMALD